MAASEKYRPASLEKLSYFMHKHGFGAPSDDELDPDSYCIGMVLEDLTGSDLLLCAIAKELAARWGLELKILQLMDRFVLTDRRGFILSPANGWRLFTHVKNINCKDWDAPMILKMVTSVLFICAVCSDSFRYVNTIGSCLAKVSGRDNLKFLPYPYNGGSC